MDFIGCHPMAGTEFSGIEHAFAEMFQKSHLILTPRPSSTPEHVSLMERMGAYIGCKDVVKTTPEEHDAILAYTSQMMHIIALSVCDDEQLFACKGFEGSSFRGCTRVAALDVSLWTELFSMNSPALLSAGGPPGGEPPRLPGGPGLRDVKALRTAGPLPPGASGGWTWRAGHPDPE